MDDGTPSLEVGFAIDTGGSFDELRQLAALMDTTEARVVAEARKIEQATSGMINVGAATASITAFASTTSREMQRAEKAAEGLTKRLQEQAATFGMTRAGAVAWRADLAGATNAATELRDAEAALNALRTEAAQKAQAEAAAYREAALGVQIFEANARRLAQLDRERDAQKAAAAAALEAAAYREAALGVEIFEQAARRQTQANREAEDAAKRDAAAVQRLREMLDPAAAAQARVNAAMVEAKRVMTAAGASAEELAGIERILNAQLDHSTTGLGKNSFALKQVAIQIPDIVQGLLTGQPVFQVFLQQGGQIAQIGAMAEGGLKGMASSALAAVRPFLAIGATVAGVSAVLIAAGSSWASYSNAIERFNGLSQGAGSLIGASGAALEASAEAAASAGNITVAAARDITAAYVQTGKIGMDVLTGLTAVTADFATATGQKSEQAAQALGAAFADPAKGADDLTEKYGLLDAKTLDYIHTLIEQGHEAQAQGVLLQALQGQFDGAAEHANVLARAWQNISSTASEAWNWMGKAIDRALGGGSAAEKLVSLQAQKARALSDSYGLADTSSYDARIADLKKQLGAERNNRARSDAVAGLKVVDSYTGDDQLGDLKTKQGAVNKLLADGGRAAGLNAEQLASARQTQEAYTHAIGSYLSPAAKKIAMDQAEAAAARARTPAEKAAAAIAKERISLSGQVVTRAEAEAQAQQKGAAALSEASKVDENAARSAAKAAENHAAALAREAAAQEAQIRNSYAVAESYKLSGGAALIAEARVKAESTAIKQRGDVEAAVARQIRLSIAQRVVEADRGSAANREQAAAQEQVNAMVAAGLVPAERAAEMVRDRIADLPLLAAIEAAQQRGLATEAARATQALEDQRTTRERLADDARAAAFLTAKAGGDDRLAELREELRLIGETDAARTHAFATLKATQEAQKYKSGDQAAYIAQQVEIADLEQQRQLRADDYNASLTFQADRLDLLANNAAKAGRDMADAFGTAGRALGDLASTFSGYIADQARLKVIHEREQKNIATIAEADKRAQAERREGALYAARTAQAQIGLYGDMAASAKGFFKEGSSGYKALADAEKVFRAVQFALSVRAIAQDAIETGSSLAKSAARTASGAVEAVVNAIKSLPFPLNIAAGAATIGALASIGVGIAGSFGGGKNNLPAANSGTGTVLGDSAAKSDSIKNAIDRLKSVDDATLNVSREMLNSLRSIETKIGGVASLLVRTGNISGASADVQTGFKTNALGTVLGSAPTALLGGALGSAIGGPIGFALGSALGATLGKVVSKIPVLGDIAGAIGGIVKSLFGSKTSVVASGLYGGQQSLSDILGSGFDLQTYADVKKTKKFFGISTGSSYSTQYGSADPQLGEQFTLILKSFNDAITAAAGPLGVATGDIQARLSGFVVNLGKLDFTGLSGDEITAKLNAIFGAAADSMADAALRGLQRFQQVGEGAFDTLVRVASTVEQVDAVFRRLGVTSGSMGADIDMAIAGLFDSVSDFTSAADTYFQDFYTQAEQSAAKTAQLGRAFASLGLAMPDTLAGFRQLVEAQNLTTDAGRQTYATLLQLAPAFSDLKTALEGAKSAADILSEREDLQKQLWELTGNTAALRAAELAKLDPSNRALQEQINAIKDAQDAAQAADQLRQAWTSVGDSIMDEVKRIRGLTDTSTGGGFASLMGQFNAATAAARAGDQDAAKSLPGLSQALLTAAADAATSRQELARIQAQTAASLEATYGVVSALASAGSTIASVDTAASSASGSTAANDDTASSVADLQNVIVGLRADLNSALSTIANNTAGTNKRLDSVTAPGGEAIQVASAA